jgi:FHS family Na+ dependent glucose MFS transporter 1
MFFVTSESIQPDFKTGFTLNHSKTLLHQNTGYFSALFLLGLMVASLGPTLGVLAEQTQSPLKGISFLFIARSTGFMLGSIFVGAIYDRLQGHRLLAIGLLILSVMIVFTPLITSLWLLTVIFLLQGGAGSIVNVGGNTLVLWANREKVGARISGLHFIWGVGASLSPVLMAKTMVLTGGIMTGYLLLSLLALPICLWISRLPSPEHPHSEERKAEEQAPRGLVVLIGGFILLYSGVEASVGNWIFTYATTTRIMDSQEAALLNSTYWGTLTVGRLAIIPIATRLRPRFILMTALGGALLSVVTIILADGAHLGVWIGVAGIGLSYASIFPTTLAFAERRLTLSGKLTGRFFACSSGGAMLFPWLIGQFFESRGPWVLPWTVLTGLLIAVGIFVLMMSFPLRVNSARTVETQ